MAIDKLTTTSFLDESVTNLKIAVSARASTVISSASVGDLSDVDITTSSPSSGQTLVWDNANSKFIPGTSFSQSDFDNALTASDTDDLSEGTTNLYYTDARADARVALVIDSAPATLDTLNELASALGDDANFSTTVTNSIANKLPLAGGTMTGNLTLGDNVNLYLGDSSDASLVFDGTDTKLTSQGELILNGQTGVTIDCNNVTNQPTLFLSDMGAGNTGILLKRATGGSIMYGQSMDHSRPKAITGTNKSLGFVVAGGGGNASYAAFDFSVDANASSRHPAVMGVRSPNNNALLFQGEQSDSTVVFSVDYDGNIATSGTVDGRNVATDGTKLDTIETNAKDDQTITAGAGLTGGGTGDVTLSHAATSSQVSLNNSGRTYIQDITLDTYGHITSLATATETVTNTNLTHTGEVTGSTSLTISDNIVDEANLKVSNAPTDGYFLSAQSGNAGGLTWATVPAGYTDSDVASYLSTNDYDTSTNIIAAITDSAPGTLDTLNELAAALGDDDNFSTTVTNSIATKLPLAGGTMTGDINFGDNIKVIFGAGSDLQIYSDGTNSFIKSPTGDLSIRSSDLLLQNANGTKYFEGKVDATHGTHVNLYQGGGIKLQTVSGGVYISGNVSLSGTVDGRDVATDGTKLDTVATNADVTDTTNVTAAGALMDSEVTNLAQVKAFDSSDYATSAQGTTADAALPKAGGTITGDILYNDNVKAKFGTSNDLEIYHDGSNSYIHDRGVGNLNIKTNVFRVYNAGGTEIMANFIQNGAAELYHDATKKFATSAAGIDVTGNIVVSGTVDGRDVATDGSKLDGIEAGANVTDTANVTAAGALMDSELASITDVKAINQSVISGATPTFGIDNLTIDDTDLVVSDTTNLQTFAEGVDSALLKARGTGVTSTYVSTVAIGGTTFAQPAVEGEINSDEGYFSISYAGATGITVANLTATSTYVYIDKSGNLQQQTSIPTRQDWSRKVFTMRIGVDTTAGTILSFEYLNNPIGHYANSIRDLYTYLLAQGIPLKKGQTVTGRSGDLGFDVGSGSIMEFGGTGDINNANILSFNAVSNTSYTLLSRTGIVSVQTDLQKYWDNNGTITALGSTTLVGHRLYRYADGTFAMQYGQGNYANMALAKAGAVLENYVLNPLLEDATFFGWWFIQSTAVKTAGTPTLTDFSEYTIGIQGGSSGSLAGCLLKGNNLSDLQDTATARTNLGLEVGVDVQSFATVLDNTTASFLIAEQSKLTGIEEGANVTDTANVTLAGALMDSEVTNLAQVKAFDETDYATAAQGTLAGSAVQPNDSPTFGGLTVDGTDTEVLITEDSEGSATLRFADTQADPAQSYAIAYDTSSNKTNFKINNTQRANFNSSGDYMVGPATADSPFVIYNGNNDATKAGVGLRQTGYIAAARMNDHTMMLNRMGTDGLTMGIRNDGTFVGGLGNVGGELTFHDSTSAEAMRLDSSGNLGIGTNNPATALDVAGTVTATAYAGDGSGLTDIARKVWESSQGSSSSANYWAKVATYSISSNFDDGTFIYHFMPEELGAGMPAIVAVNVRTNNASGGDSHTLNVELMSKPHVTPFSDDSFKLIDNGGSSDIELWVKKNDNNCQISAYEMSAHFEDSGFTITYNQNAAWQASEPTGTGLNIKTVGVKVAGNFNVTGSIAVSGTVDGRDVATDGTKLDTIATNANDYTHPNHTGEVTSTGDGATVIVDNVVDAGNLKVTGNGTTTQFLRSDGDGTFTWATPVDTNTLYTHPTHPGDDASIDTGALTGAVVISDLDFNVTTDTLGHVTDANATVATRTLTLANLGYTGETNATADQTKADIEGLSIELPAANLTGTIAAARLSTATTQVESDDSTKIATTAYVTDKITTLIGGAPSTLNDLNELAAAINDDANYNTTLTTALGTKLPLAGGAMTGPITTNSTFDGVDISVRDAVLTSTTTIAAAALPKAGGTMTGDLQLYKATPIITLQRSDNTTLPGLSWQGAGGSEAASIKLDGTAGATNTLIMSTYNGSTMAERLRLMTNAAGGIAVTGTISVTGTVDGVDIAARDAVLTSTTTTANAALPLAGGTMTGVIAGFESTGIDDNASSTSITLLSSGTVGVGGTSSSYGKLTITQSTDASNGGLGIVDSGNALSARLFSTGTVITLNAGNTGTGKLVLNAGGGNVGIGTESPQKKLEVTGDLQLDADNASIWLKSGVDGTAGKINWTYNSEGTVYASAGIDYDTRASTGFHLDVGYPITLDTSSSTGIKFITATVQRAVINNSGLGVTGNIAVTGTVDGVDIQALNTTANAALPKSGGTMTGNLTVQNGAPRVLLTETGVTNTPTWWSIADGGNYTIRLNNTGVYPLDIVTNATNDAVIHINVGYNTNFAAGIDVTGNITVSGTVDGRDVAADGTKLDTIETNATADQTAAQLLTAIKTVDGTGSGLDADLLDGQHGSYYQKKTTVQDAAPSGATGDLWYESDTGSFYVYYSGAWVDVAPGVETNTNLQINSLGVGTAASGTAGEIRATNDVTAYYSDERLKDFHGNIDSALDKVNQLNGYYFTENETAKELGYDNDKRQVGVSAQEVQAVLPEVVAAAPISDEYLTVKYEKLAPLFIEAIKEIDKKYQDKIDMLMEEIEKLKGN